MVGTWFLLIVASLHLFVTLLYVRKRRKDCVDAASIVCLCISIARLSSILALQSNDDVTQLDCDVNDVTWHTSCHLNSSLIYVIFWLQHVRRVKLLGLYPRDEKLASLVSWISCAATLWSKFFLFLFTRMNEGMTLKSGTCVREYYTIGSPTKELTLKAIIGLVYFSTFSLLAILYHVTVCAGTNILMHNAVNKEAYYEAKRNRFVLALYLLIDTAFNIVPITFYEHGSDYTPWGVGMSAVVVFNNLLLTTSFRDWKVRFVPFLER